MLAYENLKKNAKVLGNSSRLAAARSRTPLPRSTQHSTPLSARACRGVGSHLQQYLMAGALGSELKSYC